MVIVASRNVFRLAQDRRQSEGGAKVRKRSFSTFFTLAIGVALIGPSLARATDDFSSPATPHGEQQQHRRDRRGRPVRHDSPGTPTARHAWSLVVDGSRFRAQSNDSSHGTAYEAGPTPRLSLRMPCRADDPSSAPRSRFGGTPPHPFAAAARSRSPLITGTTKAQVYAGQHRLEGPPLHDAVERELAEHGPPTAAKTGIVASLAIQCGRTWSATFASPRRGADSPARSSPSICSARIEVGSRGG